MFVRSTLQCLFTFLSCSFASPFYLSSTREKKKSEETILKVSCRSYLACVISLGRKRERAGISLLVSPQCVRESLLIPSYFTNPPYILFFLSPPPLLLLFRLRVVCACDTTTSSERDNKSLFSTTNLGPFFLFFFF